MTPLPYDAFVLPLTGAPLLVGVTPLLGWLGFIVTVGTGALAYATWRSRPRRRRASRRRLAAVVLTQTYGVGTVGFEESR